MDVLAEDTMREIKSCLHDMKDFDNKYEYESCFPEFPLN
jgi:hypothetical protein